jgi:hypothetical protein
MAEGIGALADTGLWVEETYEETDRMASLSRATFVRGRGRAYTLEESGRSAASTRKLALS